MGGYVKGCIEFLREAWKHNDGAEGDSVRLVCDEVERLQNELTIANNQIDCAYNRMCPCCASKAVVKRTEVSKNCIGDPPMQIFVRQVVTKCTDCEEEWIHSSDRGAIDTAVAAHTLALTKTQAARIAELEAELATYVLTVKK